MTLEAQRLGECNVTAEVAVFGREAPLVRARGDVCLGTLTPGLGSVQGLFQELLISGCCGQGQEALVAQAAAFAQARGKVEASRVTISVPEPAQSNKSGRWENSPSLKARAVPGSHTLPSCQSSTSAASLQLLRITQGHP